MNDIWDDVDRLEKESRLAMPDSGQFASTRETQSFIEKSAIEEVLAYLHKYNGWAPTKHIQQPDPPDAIVTLVGGTKIWCEFASVTHQATMQVIKHRQKNNQERWLYQDWTQSTFQTRLRELIASKEALFARHIENRVVFRPLMLVLGSDSTMSHTGLLVGFDIKSTIFDVIAVHLGYSPAATTAGNGGYLIHIVAGNDLCLI